MHDMLKRKICKEHEKKKESKCFYYGCKCVSRKFGTYMMYLKGDGPHHIMIYLCSLSKVPHTTRVLFATLDTIA